ncbi:MAG: GNAT family N-acetyltransferase [Pseudomonadota bacterium]
MSTITIRPATIDDTSQILTFVRDLAIYEKAEHEVLATEAHIQETLFCDDPKVEGLIAEIDGTPVGFAVYFFNYSTWLGKHGIYLEDLYVSPKSRGAGAGKALLKRLAEIAVAKDCGRVEWSVLDWNQPAIDFYLSLGARPQDEWTVYRLTGAALQEFAAS